MCVPANSLKRGPAGNWGGGAAAPAAPPVAPALAQTNSHVIEAFKFLGEKKLITHESWN